MADRIFLKASSPETVHPAIVPPLQATQAWNHAPGATPPLTRQNTEHLSFTDTQPDISAHPSLKKFEGKVKDVKALLRGQGLLPEKRLDFEVDYFFGPLGLPDYYYINNSLAEIASHISVLYAAKVQSASNQTPLEVQLTSASAERAMFVVRSVRGSNQSPALEVERKIESEYLHEGFVETEKSLRDPYRVSIFRTLGSVTPDSGVFLRMYFMQRLALPKPTGSKDVKMAEIANADFLQENPAGVLAKYETVVRRALNSLGPIILFTQDDDRKQFGENVDELFIAYRSGSTHSYFSAITILYHKYHMSSNSKFIEHFSNGITVYRLLLTPTAGEQFTTEKKLRFVEDANLLFVLPRTSLTPLFVDGKLSAKEVSYAYAAWKFAFHFTSRQTTEFSDLQLRFKEDPQASQELRKIKNLVQKETFSELRVKDAIFANPELVRDFYRDFEHHFLPGANPEHTHRPGDKNLKDKILKSVADEFDRKIFEAIFVFNHHLLKTNFFKSTKIALSFRFEPSFLPKDVYPVKPFAVSFVVGPEFRGFHIRFRDIARGGIRLIKSPNMPAYIHNLTTVFDENYNLAQTQERKNKDIPEGGSKGTVLLSIDHQGKAAVAFQKYIDSLLDLLLLPDPEIVDLYGKQEILFFGPDENTAEYMDWACVHAKARQYPFWKAITTGKSRNIGGIPHDTYGMTTRGVHQYVLGCLEKLKWKEEAITKFQTGGPDGDLGSNEIKISHDQTIGIVDGSGVLYDPKGINRAELTRIANIRKMSREFDKSKLSPQGFFVDVNDKDITLPDGSKVASGFDFRNNFHLNKYTSADIFVPCGGRPEAVNMSNVEQLFKEDKQCLWKVVVEGANLFFTQDARLYLEKKGVVVIKDASANKGGVTSSSLEVLAALAMSDEEYKTHMNFPEGAEPPTFYQNYVSEVQQIIEMNARFEFDALWRESERLNVPKSILSDTLSNKINELSIVMENSDLWEDTVFRRSVFEMTIPKNLQQLVGLDKIVERIPINYAKASFGSFVASRYIYSEGLSSTPEFAFHNFLLRLKKQH